MAGGQGGQPAPQAPFLRPPGLPGNFLGEGVGGEQGAAGLRQGEAVWEGASGRAGARGAEGGQQPLPKGQCPSQTKPPGLGRPPRNRGVSPARQGHVAVVRSPGLVSPLTPKSLTLKPQRAHLQTGHDCAASGVRLPPRGSSVRQALPAPCWVGKSKGVLGVGSLTQFAPLGGGGGET